MVALTGEGQEIHPGEESGLAQWNDFIIGDAETVDVFNYPEKITDVFTKAGKLEKMLGRTIGGKIGYSFISTYEKQRMQGLPFTLLAELRVQGL